MTEKKKKIEFSASMGIISRIARGAAPENNCNGALMINICWRNRYGRR
jgi:hypothetical protein